MQDVDRIQLVQRRVKRRTSVNSVVVIVLGLWDSSFKKLPFNIV